ncbi:MAG TPA: acyltransferase family protein [Bacteroidia bacterium]|nr:acyltransferase family protein [Bacteroidia bacterium]
MSKPIDRPVNYNYLDILRFSACFAVILLHYSGSYTYRIEIPTFNTGVQYFTITRWCVPVFLMVSGALLLGRNEDMLLFYKKRLLRILPPFLFWSAVYLGFKFYLHQIDLNAVPQMLLAGGAEFHLWYVYMILGIILFLPFLTPWTEKKNKTSILLFVLIWIYWLIFFNEYSKAAIGLDLTYFGGYLGYLVLGYYLHILPVKKYHWLIGILLLGVGLTYSYYTSIQLSYELKTFSEYNQRYLSWNVLLTSAGVFLVAKQLVLPSRLMAVVKEVAKYSFSIYLAHIFVRDNLVKNYFDFVQLDQHSFILLKTLLVMCFSYLLAKALSFIPLAGKFISG